MDDAFGLEQQHQEFENKKQLPVLPPLILLDFVDNETIATDEKAKRTIDSNLGYGYGNDVNLFSGKHNYYLPNVKTGVGTAVSIEDLEPKIKPITEKTEINDERKKLPYEELPDPLPLQNEEPLPIYPPFGSVFGQRTKLQKTTSANFENKQQRLPNGYTMLPDLRNHDKQHPTGYYTSQSRPIELTDFSNNNNNYHHHRYVRPTTTGTSYYPNRELNLRDYPKFSVENGIRYEHKIVWKYPDGKVSEMPPLNFYTSEQPQRQLNPPPETIGGFRPSLPPLRPPVSSSANHNSFNNPTTTQNNIYSQKPVQFPNDQEQSSMDRSKQPDETNGFVSVSSTSSLTDSNDAVYKQGTGYNRPAISYSNQYTSYVVDQRPNNYDYNLFSSDGRINKNVLAKYTPQAQHYLAKVFSGKKTPVNDESIVDHNHQYRYQQQSHRQANDLDFFNLINNNPSLSQYVKNPSFILKAQPTFVQAGSTLIPVIILRVDGAPPVQTKPGSNVNLKSLLRQYLTRYANSLTKTTNYDSNGGGIVGDRESSYRENPLDDLKQLTETLESLRKRGHKDSDFLIDGYHSNSNHRSVYTTQQQHKDVTSDYVVQVKKPQKIKSVQIIEDPRFTSYKINDNN